jgi:hypothetical protein
MKPAVAIVVLLALVGFVRADDQATTAARTAVRSDGSAAVLVGPKESECEIYEELARNGFVEIDGKKLTIYAKEVKERRLIQMTAVSREKDGRITMLATADEGEVNIDTKRKALLLRFVDANLTCRGGRARVENMRLAFHFPIQEEEFANVLLKLLWGNNAVFLKL